MYLTCNICGKPLSNPISTPRASYDWGITQGVVWIEDLDQGKSVTNDIENVIADIKEHILGKPVIYKDSLGVWDGISISNNKFTGFYSINERGLQSAILKVKSMKSVRSCQD